MFPMFEVRTKGFTNADENSKSVRSVSKCAKWHWGYLFDQETSTGNKICDHKRSKWLSPISFIDQIILSPARQFRNLRHPVRRAVIW